MPNKIIFKFGEPAPKPLLNCSRGSILASLSCWITCALANATLELAVVAF